VLTLDADTNLETVTRYGVRSLPTVLLFDRGVLVDRQVAAQSFQTYAAAVERVLAYRATGLPPVPVAGTATASPAARAANGSPEAAEVEALAASDTPLVIFKHSATCIISITVKQQYDAFVAANPGVPTRLVVVQQERPLSNAIEDVLRVQHESPQALVVHQGRVLWHASHRRITADALAQAVRV
jgi:thioredoxin 1